MEYIIRTQVSYRQQELNLCVTGCGYLMRFLLFAIVLSVHIVSGAESGIEVLKNGALTDHSLWYVAPNGDASYKDTVENNILSVIIASPGSESWFIQLTQNKVIIKKDKIYILSFDIKSSQPRTILSSVCRDGGDYLPYSKRDTVKVDTLFTRYKQEFIMVQPTDSLARVEFNLGQFNGNIHLKNISLMEYSEPKITFTGISPQNVAYSDEPIKLSWTSIGLRDTLKLSVSYDDGYSWSVIKSNLKSADSLEWIPGNTHSPFCLFKLSTTITSTTTTPLQIFPKIELITNGSFRNSSNNWILITDTSVVQTTMMVQNSTLTLSSTYKKPSEGAVKFSQSSIKLEKGYQYDVFFTCNAKTICSLLVSLTDCTTLLTTGTNGSEKATFGIDSTPTRYHVRFVSNKSTTNGELQFLPDTAAKEISFSNISLINVSMPASILSYTRSTPHDNNRSQFRPVFLSGKAQTRIPFEGTSEYFNLSGRKISGKQLDPAYRRFHGSGVIIVVPRNNDHNKKFDNK